MGDRVTRRYAVGFLKGILQSPDYVKNLQNVPGCRGIKGENVNPLFCCTKTKTTSGIAIEIKSGGDYAGCKCEHRGAGEKRM